MWVLDDRDDALFAYDLASGELLAEYALHDDNDTPHGIWSDRVSVWVSNHDPKRLFAYRVPVPDAEDAEALELERVRDEEFDKLNRASNNSPRGIWSDGDVMYVVDASDGKVYSYNMPDAIDARLASLTLSGVDIGEFSSSQTEYEGVAADGVTRTMVEASAAQHQAAVAIEPADSDEVADGRQAAVADGAEITVTVTSPDGTRNRVYLVRITVRECLGGLGADFSLVAYEGGGIADLEACARSLSVEALYAWDGSAYLSYILDAPLFVNEGFVALFPEGLPDGTELLARREPPPAPGAEAGGN